MADSLDALEEEAAARRKRGAGREAGEPRFPRKKSQQDAAARSDELQKRERERERRRQQAQATEKPAPDSEPPPASDPQPAPRREEAPTQTVTEAAPKTGKRARPTSMPFYPNPEHEAFLWSVTEAAAARQLRIPATAVLRLALSRLQEQMTPSEIVRELGSSVHPEGKMGRPRL